MSESTITVFHCDDCGKKLSRMCNAMDIRTSKSEGSYWQRLHIKIKHRSGMNNDATERDADLCKACAVALLRNALERVSAGERATKGTESTKQEDWSTE